MDFEKVIEDCLKWSNETFGIEKTSIRKMYHLKQEIDEVIEILEEQNGTYPPDKSKFDDNLLVEYADCFMLLATSAMAKGYSFAEITKAVSDKLEINKKRSWGPPDINGVVNHI